MSTVLPSTQSDAGIKTYKMYYGGQWHDAADGGHFDVHEPYIDYAVALRHSARSSTRVRSA
jgi:hypothetical protein